MTTMKTSTLLETCFALAIGYFGSTACVARDCTAAEQQEVGATGADECSTYTPPEQHEGDATTDSVPYTAGANLVVQGDWRNLEIEAFPSGGTGEVEVKWTPVVDLAEGRSDDVVEATLAELDVTVSDSESEITVTADRSGKSNVAAILQIRIPDDFDGNIEIDQRGDKNDAGEAELTFLANAKNLNVNLNASGDTLFIKGSKLETAAVQVNGFWNIAADPFSSPDFKGAKFISDSGDIKATFPAIPPSAAVQVESEDGDLDLRIPGEGDYTMQSTSTDFSFAAAIPPSCSENTNAGGGSLTCGAGSDDMELDYQFKTDGKIEVGFVNLVE
jgi:hypothetical protein